jgi:hypothetical protein
MSELLSFVSRDTKDRNTNLLTFSLTNHSSLRGGEAAEAIRRRPNRRNAAASNPKLEHDLFNTNLLSV